MLDIEEFISNGYLKVPQAFSTETAAACREILWRDVPADPDDPNSWSGPVVRLWDYPQEPFRRAANTPALHAAFDALVGPGRWQLRVSLGTFVIRFPSTQPPGDDGWHIDASFGDDPDDFGSWRVNIESKGRALLMLFLFSDVGPDDAPTRIRVGSHRNIPALLAPAGPEGRGGLDFAAEVVAATDHCSVSYATGQAGDVYLCHPFLVHAAQPHRGNRPRILAQPPLYPAAPLRLDRPDGDDYSPVETAIRRGSRGPRARRSPENAGLSGQVRRQ
jgi:hypothetical protein